MNCVHCGTEVRGPYCVVCGEATATATDADRDGVGALALAGWWRRVGATLVDDLILLVPSLVAFAAFNAVAGTVAGALASLAVQGLYMVTLLSSRHGRTLGNRVVGTRVCDALTGTTITKQQALKRWGLVALYSAPGLFVQSNSSLRSNPLLIVSILGLFDVLYPLLNARKQTWHDRFAGSIVVVG